MDYLNKLNEEEKAFLNSFNEEWVNANFNHKGEKLHKTKKQRKACYDRNNARNRCIYTKAATGRTLEFIEDLKGSINFDDGKQEKNLLEQVSDFNNSRDDSSNSSD